VLRVIFRRIILLAIIAGIGSYSRHHPVGFYLWDKSTGDLCYAAAAFLLIGIIAPSMPPIGIAMVALVYCIAIECFKLTALPAKWDGNPVLRVIFGSTFSVHNLICYVIAIAVLFGVESALEPKKSSRTVEQ
jgi:hypothetical protein